MSRQLLIFLTVYICIGVSGCANQQFPVKADNDSNEDVNKHVLPAVTLCVVPDPEGVIVKSGVWVN